MYHNVIYLCDVIKAKCTIWSKWNLSSLYTSGKHFLWFLATAKNLCFRVWIRCGLSINHGQQRVPELLILDHWSMCCVLCIPLKLIDVFLFLPPYVPGRIHKTLRCYNLGIQDSKESFWKWGRFGRELKCERKIWLKMYNWITDHLDQSIWWADKQFNWH